jgi:hypothetical protein
MSNGLDYIATFINWVVGALNANCFQPWYIRPYTTGMTKYQLIIIKHIIFGNQFIVAIRHLVFFKFMANILQLSDVSRTALSRGILAIYHTSSGLIA